MLPKMASKIGKPGPLLDSNIWELEKSGLLQTANSRPKIVNYFIQFCSWLVVLAQYIELWIIRHDQQLALRNLSFSLLATVCMAKAIMLLVRQNDWQDLIAFVTASEFQQRSQKDPFINDIIEDYTKNARQMNRYYALLVYCTVGSAIFLPLMIYLLGSDPDFYVEIFSLYVPFDKTHGLGHFIYYTIQIWLFVWGGSIVWGFDALSIAVTIFFCGQLRLLKLNCERIFSEKNGRPVEDEEAFERIMECQKHHHDLMRYCKVMNLLISPVMFFYVVVCSLMICASAIRLTQENISTIELIWISEFFSALILQLFFFAWHCNAVTYMSEEVSYSVFSCKWYDTSVRMQRLVYLLAGQLKKTVVFTAGPFASLNLGTFINILKGSYSYYTLLK